MRRISCEATDCFEGSSVYYDWYSFGWNQKVLGFTIAPTESAYIWKEVLQDLRKRGLEEVLLVVTDGLSGIEESIHSVYPNAQFQQCCVHVSRNIAHKVRVRDRKEICEDFKLVYQANSKEEALDHRLYD